MALRIAYVSLCSWWLVSTAFAMTPAEEKTAPPKNVLFILADDLGYSDTTLYGTTWLYETPNIERLAGRGMLFTNAYAASPICSATRASIMTGQEPGRLGFTAAGGHMELEVIRARFRTATEIASRPKLKFKKASTAISATRLTTEVETLAKTLQRSGYATGHFGKWHLGPEPFSPLEHGFDVDLPHWSGSGPGKSYLAPWQFPEELNFSASVPQQHIEDRMVQEAVKFMEQHQHEPFFLNYWAFSVHSPFGTKPELIQKYAERVHSINPQRSAVYAGMVQSFDEAVGALLDALDRLGLSEQTIVVFYSDNGGSTYDQIQGVPATSNAPLRGGKGNIYEGGTRVPAAVIWPGRIEPGSRSEAFISSTDWFPTLLEMLDVEQPEEHIFDGVSQVPTFLGNKPARSTIYSYLPHYFPLPETVPSTSIRKGNWKLIRFHHDGKDQRDRFELYDLASDIGESKNLATTHPDRVRALDSEIESYLRTIGALVPVRNPTYAPAAIPSENMAVPDPS